ncbi:arylacetamide deacetylase-like 4 family member 1 [Phodopus roborovskii]|uniref:arylacetamide deacetylase-like 4 family member 1 n=1 Tax=Phodopus roborovskii TaxID=109678 RepID=UPI0021E4667D|nr:arylacetamide deacetylase-like 4 family member 1 [Phodopus roborovskii]
MLPLVPIELFLAALCLLVLGVNLWVLLQHLLKTDIPPSIPHRMRFRILHYLFQLTMTWGNILEKLRICSMPKFFRFLHDAVTIKRNYQVVVTDLCFEEVPVRLFQPKATSSSLRRGIIFIHGGGGVFGSLDSYHTLCSFLAQKTDSVLLAVGYRKLPDYPHPAGLQDCLNASIHFLKSLKAYGVDPSRVVICGESIGGSAAATIIQIVLGRPDLPQIRAQVLIYPILQTINFQLPSHLQNQNVPFLTRDFMITCILKYFIIDPSWKDAILTGAYIPPDTWMKYREWLSSDNIPQRFGNKIQQPQFPRPFNKSAYLELKQFMDISISPLVADNEVIAQLPEALLVSIHWDVLRDDILLYKKRLEDHGVPVTWYNVEDGFHGCIFLFDKFFSFPCCWTIINAIVSFIKGI